MANDKVVRVHVTLPTLFKEKADALALETGAASTSDVVRDALKFYAWAIEEEKKGNKVIIQSPDGTVVQMKITL